MYKAFLNAVMIVAAVLVPINIWTAIVPHLHDFTAMRLLHLVSSAVFALALGLLANNCPITKNKCAPLVKVVGVTYGLFLLIMIIVNVNIARTGMGVDYGWLDHYFLAFGSLAIIWQVRNRELNLM